MASTKAYIYIYIIFHHRIQKNIKQAEKSKGNILKNVKIIPLSTQVAIG